ncbi:MAG: MFS transporter [Myxococcota bacterium]|nr:MFS transporter [Myxococcota bacterium]
MISPQPSTSAFSYAAYRRFWFSNLAMVFAMQFRFIGSGWLVHELTDSPFWLGVPGLVSAAVTILLTVPGGALADRIDARRLLVAGRAASGVLHLALAVVTVTGIVEVWMVIVWAALTGVSAAVTSPAGNALLPRLIDHAAMPSAVALSSSIWSGMRIIGPAAAGILIAAIGIGTAFFVTAAGFAISTGLIASLRLETPPDAETETEHDGMFAGLDYILRNRIFLATIGLSFFTSIFGRSYVVLLPVFADDVLQAGVRGFGYLEAAAGVGALLGTLAITRIKPGRHAGGTMIGAAVLFGCWVAAFAVSRSLPLSLGLLFAGAFFSAIYLTLGMTTLQLLVPNELRGRVMGVWSLTWFLSSAGGFVAATAAEFLGAPVSVALGALAVAGFGIVVFLSFPEIRHLPSQAELAAARS